MKFPLAGLALAMSASLSCAAHADTVVWDQGLSTGTPGSISWQNQTDAQNFADSVEFSSDTVVNGYTYYTNWDLSRDTWAGAFHLKILADNGGTPGNVISSQDLAFRSIASDGNGISELHFAFAPQTFAAGTTYWVGLSGNGFEAAQISLGGLQGIAPHDGKMAQFEGHNFAFMAGVGDQAFQLTYSVSAVPEPGSLALMLAGLGCLGFVARRRARG
jgi:hypothetical protein